MLQKNNIYCNTNSPAGETAPCGKGYPRKRRDGMHSAAKRFVPVFPAADKIFFFRITFCLWQSTALQPEERQLQDAASACDSAFLMKEGMNPGRSGAFYISGTLPPLERHAPGCIRCRFPVQAPPPGAIRIHSQGNVLSSPGRNCT